MKKLKVKTSKLTGYKYLEAPKVKEIIDDLLDYQKTQTLYNKFLDTRISKLEHSLKSLLS